MQRGGVGGGGFRIDFRSLDLADLVCYPGRCACRCHIYIYLNIFTYFIYVDNLGHPLLTLSLQAATQFPVPGRGGGANADKYAPQQGHYREKCSS